MTVEFRKFEVDDVAAALDLWSEAEGIGLGTSDSPAHLEAFLARNPGLSWVALRGASLAGAALCGHDGRRGYIHHLAVAPSERRSGIGRKLVAQCLSALRDAGIVKCHIFVFRANPFGELFWSSTGWQRRDDVDMFSHFL
jgi:ribosomal protein S18 acetylase RimI-like enzyme